MLDGIEKQTEIRTNSADHDEDRDSRFERYVTVYRKTYARACVCVYASVREKVCGDLEYDGVLAWLQKTMRQNSRTRCPRVAFRTHLARACSPTERAFESRPRRHGVPTPNDDRTVLDRRPRDYHRPANPLPPSFYRRYLLSLPLLSPDTTYTR